MYTSREKIYARVRVHAPGVIKGVNDGRGKSHNPLLFADLSVFRDASSGVALSGPGAMNERRRNKRWRLLGLSMLYPLSPLHILPRLSIRTHIYTYIHVHARDRPQYKGKKMYQTPATAVNDFRIFPLRPTDKYLEEQKKITPG